MTGQNRSSLRLYRGSPRVKLALAILVAKRKYRSIILAHVAYRMWQERVSPGPKVT